MSTVRLEDRIVQQIPIECFEMSNIKDDAGTLRNRALVERAGAHQTEDGIALPASVGHSFDEFVGNFLRNFLRNYDSLFCSWHSALLTGRFERTNGSLEGKPSPALPFKAWLDDETLRGVAGEGDFYFAPKCSKNVRNALPAVKMV